MSPEEKEEHVGRMVKDILLLIGEIVLFEQYVDDQDIQIAKLLQEFRDNREDFSDGGLKTRLRNAVEDPNCLAEILEIPTQREHEPAIVPDDIGLVMQLAEIRAEECVMECRIEANQVLSLGITQAILANERCLERLRE
ncbi:hypothetical protein JCM24511_00900 [Saitozyma sp. JCM 24511]|nr:hypothetical protein JCM24511_00900 [Saitozyma sp. JCM 24511]